MTESWLPGAVHNRSTILSNGPFAKGAFRGVVLHVNAGHTTDAMFTSPNASNCPNFQVYESGPPSQYMPVEFEPASQIDGNGYYGAIETEGWPADALNANQLYWCAKIIKFYHDVMGMRLQVTDSPVGYGFGTHVMGGAAWGGHTCPGPGPRAGQRVDILKALFPIPVTPIQKGNDEMILVRFVNGGPKNLENAVYLVSGGVLVWIDSHTYNTLGQPLVRVEDARFSTFWKLKAAAGSPDYRQG